VDGGRWTVGGGRWTVAQHPVFFLDWVFQHLNSDNLGLGAETQFKVKYRCCATVNRLPSTVNRKKHLAVSFERVIFEKTFIKTFLPNGKI